LPTITLIIPIGSARLGRIDPLVLGRVDAFGGVGGEHEISAITHPLGVDLGDALVSRSRSRAQAKRSVWVPVAVVMG
jgi:hypothetical protein